MFYSHGVQVKKKSIATVGNFTPARFVLLCLAIFCSLAFLLGRVAWLQIIKPDNLVKQEDMRSLRQLAIDAPRGMIMDREGRPLAVSVPVQAVWADPKTVLAKGGVNLYAAEPGRAFFRRHVLQSQQ